MQCVRYADRAAKVLCLVLPSLRPLRVAPRGGCDNGT